MSKKSLAEYFDLKKLLQYGQILVEFSDNGASVTGINESKETVFLERDYNALEGSHEDILYLCKVFNIINAFLGIDNSKHQEYRYVGGAYPNGDESLTELYNIIKDTKLVKEGGEEKLASELYDKGYEIVKISQS